MPVAVNACRFLIALTFIFSGFVKAVDPEGLSFKIAEYLSAFGYGGVLHGFAMTVIAVVLPSFEFIVGIHLLFAIKRRLTSLFAFAFMVLMTPLTLYLAVANPVSDCGCFGDAVVLSNWQTFGKNVILLAMTLVVMLRCKLMFRVMTWRVQWIVTAYSVVFILSLSVYCLNNLPIIDFRPYKVGVNIQEAMSSGDDAAEYETTFFLEKDGVKRGFSLDEYPDSTWNFLYSTTVQVGGHEPSITDFSIIDIESGRDLTLDILSDTSYMFLLIVHDISKASDLNIDRINDIYDYCKDNGYAFYCLTASNDSLISYWQDYMGAGYDFYFTDETALKTMVRSNPGLMLLKGGTIVNKWHHRHLPGEHDLSIPDLSSLPVGRVQSCDWFVVVACVVLLYFLPLALIIGIETIWLKVNNMSKSEESVSNNQNDKQIKNKKT